MKSIQLHQTQSQVAKDTHPYRLVCCGRQWGKTTLAVLEMIANAYSAPGREVAYFAPTYDQARNIAWAMLKDFSRSIWVKPPNESRLELLVHTKDKGQSRITLRGFENVETARGQQFDFLVIDELAQMKNWNYAWQAILEPTLAFRKGQALYISTPRGYNEFFHLFQKGQEDNDLIKSWQFKSSDNPHLPLESIEKARQNSSDDFFMQEYEADFRRHTGLALKNWNRDIHFIDAFDIPPDWHFARGFDFGKVDFTASVRAAISPDGTWFIDSCYLNNTSDVRTHAHAILSEDYGKGFIPYFGDPSGKQWMEEFKMHDVFIEPAVKTTGQGFRGYQEFCIAEIDSGLKPVAGNHLTLPDGRLINDAPSLFVLKTGSTDKLVSQIEKLSWKQTITGDNIPVLDEDGDPTGGHYDLMAALRYLAVSYDGTQDEDIQLPDDASRFRGAWY